MLIRCVDIETTGTDPDDDKICEYAYVDLSLDEDEGKLKRVWMSGSLVDPEIPIPPTASAIHHITDEDLEGNSVKLDSAIDDLKGADVYVAHNAKFEASFLPELGPWICTYKVALRAWPNALGHSLQVLRYWRGHLNISRLSKNEPMHRAMPDALVCQTIFVDLLGEGFSVGEMLAMSEEPAQLPCFRFGKHANTPLAEVPKDYLEWCVKNLDDEDVVFSAQNELRMRGRK